MGAIAPILHRHSVLPDSPKFQEGSSTTGKVTYLVLGIFAALVSFLFLPVELAVFTTLGTSLLAATICSPFSMGTSSNPVISPNHHRPSVIHGRAILQPTLLQRTPLTLHPRGQVTVVQPGMREGVGDCLVNRFASPIGTRGSLVDCYRDPGDYTSRRGTSSISAQNRRDHVPVGHGNDFRDREGLGQDFDGSQIARDLDSEFRTVSNPIHIKSQPAQRVEVGRRRQGE